MGIVVQSCDSDPLQVLTEVHEHAHACMDAVLLRLPQQVLLVLFRRQERLVEAALPLQLPVLVDEVEQVEGQPQLLRHLVRLHQLVELLLQLFELLRPQPHLLGLGRGFVSGRAQTRLGRFGLAVLQAVGFELDLVAFIQDGLHLQVVLEGAGDVEGDGAVLHRTLKRERKQGRVRRLAV